MHLLSEARDLFAPRPPYLIAEHISVRGMIPEEDMDKDVSETIRAKLLTRRLAKVDDNGDRPLDLLPGQIAGTGVSLVGDTDAYHWHADIGPAHAAPSLPISADLYFPMPQERAEDSMISESLSTAYEFVTDNVVQFAQKILG